MYKCPICGTKMVRARTVGIISTVQLVCRSCNCTIALNRPVAFKKGDKVKFLVDYLGYQGYAIPKGSQLTVVSDSYFDEIGRKTGVFTHTVELEGHQPSLAEGCSSLYVDANFLELVEISKNDN
jgi:transcription elongation factor Elf1